MANSEASSQSRVLLVEGPDDKHVVRQLCRLHPEMPEFCISSKDGIDALLQGIRGEILGEERTAVGILVDANEDLNNRWRALTDRLQRAGIVPPDSPNPSGTIIESTPRVGIWVMPDNGSPGELENFVAEMIPLDDPVWPLSQLYVDGIPAEHRKFRPGKLLRAKLYAWLATREIPGRMGAAIGAGDLSVDEATSVRFVDWLRELFK